MLTVLLTAEILRQALDQVHQPQLHAKGSQGTMTFNSLLGARLHHKQLVGHGLYLYDRTRCPKVGTGTVQLDNSVYAHGAWRLAKTARVRKSRQLTPTPHRPRPIHPHEPQSALQVDQSS